MDVLIGCEFSGAIREAFRERGHNAWSCDVLPAEDGSPYHYQTDILQMWHKCPTNFDLGIFTPPCTHLAVSGARWFPEKRQDGRQQAAIDFFLALWNYPCERIAIENPIGIMSTVFRKPDQIIQPWMFGHGETKATCLWLKNLPKLKPTKVVDGRHGRVWREAPSPDRWKNRSRTLPGIAAAMAAQWG